MTQKCARYFTYSRRDGIFSDDIAKKTTESCAERILTRNPAIAGMADRTAPVVKLTSQKIVIPSGIGLAAVHSWQLDTCASVYKL